jgi:hypothetical protein
VNILDAILAIIFVFALLVMVITGIEIVKNRQRNLTESDESEPYPEWLVERYWGTV